MDMELISKYLRHGVRLNRIGQPEAGHAPKQSESAAQQRITRPQAIADVVHRATAVPALVILLAIPHCQYRLGIFHCHTE